MRLHLKGCGDCVVDACGPLLPNAERQLWVGELCQESIHRPVSPGRGLPYRETLCRSVTSSLRRNSPDPLRVVFLRTWNSAAYSPRLFSGSKRRHRAFRRAYRIASSLATDSAGRSELATQGERRATGPTGPRSIRSVQRHVRSARSRRRTVRRRNRSLGLQPGVLPSPLSSILPTTPM